MERSPFTEGQVAQGSSQSGFPPISFYLFTGDSLTLKNDLHVKASGKMYEENTLILNMTYQGEAESNERNFKIYGDDIRMAATRND